MINLEKHIRGERSLGADDVLEQIANAIEAFAAGGPDLEADMVALAECARLDVRVIRDQWCEAKAKRPSVVEWAPPDIEPADFEPEPFEPEPEPEAYADEPDELERVVWITPKAKAKAKAATPAPVVSDTTPAATPLRPASWRRDLSRPLASTSANTTAQAKPASASVASVLAGLIARAKAGGLGAEAVAADGRLTENEKAQANEVDEWIEDDEVEADEAEVVVATPLPAPVVWRDPDASGNINWPIGGKSLRNAKIAIAKLGIQCQFDDFHKRYIVHGHPCMKGGSVSESLDNMALMVRNEISKTFDGLDITKGLVMEALMIKCMERAFDPVKDYLDTREWDGRPRLDRWLIDYCGAEDTEYVRAVGRKVLVAAVRRVRVPGCKFDYMMVMEGHQGAGKSTALEILAGKDQFSDAQILRLREKEQQELLAGIWIYEIAELAGKHIDVEAVKAFLSKMIDAARAAYGHGRTDQRRRCVFIATTNNDQYLRDHTGNRRFWPVRVGSIDLDALRLDRDQLWAEAAMCEATGEPLVIPAHLWGVAASEAAGRMEHDPWADILGEKLASLEAGALAGKALSTKLFLRGEDADGPHWRVASEYLMTEVLSIPVARHTPYQSKRLSATMQSLGWLWRENPLRFGKGGQKRGFTKLILDDGES